jgi:antitoxin component of RelBE/YafQ-DinJ toxin-antitoxin module
MDGKKEKVMRPRATSSKSKATARLTIDLSRTEHKRLKTAASLMGTTMKDLVLISVDEFLLKKPNKVTLKAMKQSESGKGLKKFKNLEEFFEDLGI